MINFKGIFTTLILAVTLLIIIFASLPRIDRYLTIKAVEICSSASKITKVVAQDSYTAEYSVDDLYTKCLDQTK